MATSVIRASILGGMPGGEVWSVNPCFFLLDEPADITASEALTIATAIDALTVPTGVRGYLNAATTITGCRVEARDRNGALQALGEHVRSSAVVGTGPNSHPYQTSAVTSLRSGYPGGQGRGRLYWPATGAPLVTGTLRFDTTAFTAFAAGVKQYLTDIRAAVAVTAGPSELTVWSRTGSAFHTVTSLRHGDVADTQRRRRDALTESYSELAFP